MNTCRFMVNEREQQHRGDARVLELGDEGRRLLFGSWLGLGWCRAARCTRGRSGRELEAFLLRRALEELPVDAASRGGSSPNTRFLSMKSPDHFAVSPLSWRAANCAPFTAAALSRCRRATGTGACSPASSLVIPPIEHDDLLGHEIGGEHLAASAVPPCTTTANGFFSATVERVGVLRGFVGTGGGDGLELELATPHVEAVARTPRSSRGTSPRCTRSGRSRGPSAATGRAVPAGCLLFVRTDEQHDLDRVLVDAHRRRAAVALTLLQRAGARRALLVRIRELAVRTAVRGVERGLRADARSRHRRSDLRLGLRDRRHRGHERERPPVRAWSGNTRWRARVRSASFMNPPHAAFPGQRCRIGSAETGRRRGRPRSSASAAADGPRWTST